MSKEAILSAPAAASWGDAALRSEPRLDPRAFDPAQVRNVTVVRALGGLGDVLCAVPALRAIRRGLPAARVGYIGLPQVESIVARFPELVDRFVTFPGFPGVIEYPFKPERLTTFLDAQRGSARVDLAIQMHGSGGVTNIFTALLGATTATGYFLPGLWRPGPWFTAFPEHLPEVQRWTALADGLGFAAEDDRLSFPVFEHDRDALAAIAPQLAHRPYAVVHVGASDPCRRWPVDRFAQIGDLLARLGLQVVLTGTSGEAGITAAVAGAMRKDALNLCGKTSLGAAAALIDRAHLVVTNDTGTAHLATALATPSVVIFIASDPARWGPLDRRRHQVVGEGVADARFGQAATAPIGRVPQLDEVADAIHHMMAVAA